VSDKYRRDIALFSFHSHDIGRMTETFSGADRLQRDATPFAGALFNAPRRVYDTAFLWDVARTTIGAGYRPNGARRPFTSRFLRNNFQKYQCHAASLK
jgi:hypothetical protein